MAALNQLDYLTKKVEFENGHHGWIAQYVRPQSEEDEVSFICKTWKKETVKLSLSKVQEAMDRYNKNRELIPLSQLNKDAEAEFDDKNNKLIIKKCELNWMIQQKPLVYDKKDVLINLGEEEAKKLFEEISKFDKKMESKNYNKNIFGALAWNGTISRWRQFMKFINEKFKADQNENDDNNDEKKNDEKDEENMNDDEKSSQIIKDAKDALLQFGSSLGMICFHKKTFFCVSTK